MSSLATTDAISSTALSELMKKWKIRSDIVPALVAFGVEIPSDIVDLEPSDVEELIESGSLKRVEANRFRKSYNAMVGAASPATSLPVAPLVSSAQGEIPIAVTVVDSNVSSFEEREKMIRDQLEREHRSQLLEANQAGERKTTESDVVKDVKSLTAEEKIAAKLGVAVNEIVSHMSLLYVVLESFSMLYTYNSVLLLF